MNPDFPKVNFPRFDPALRMAYEQNLIEVVRLGGTSANPMRDYDHRGYRPDLNRDTRVWLGQLAGACIDGLFDTFEDGSGLDVSFTFYDGKWEII